MILHAQEEPVDGPMAMALDEVLLEGASEATLRTWRWAETTLSIGCFVRMDEAREIGGDTAGLAPVVRRWTGGGCVTHERGRDFSYSLILPRGHDIAALRPLESYAWIHERLVAALRSCGIDAGLTGELPDGEGLSRDCFRRPVPFDVLRGTDGEKISGAGQKRTKKGLLHQGNIRVAALPRDFPQRLANVFASTFEARALEEEALAAARALAAKKYASADWTEKY